MEEDRSSTRVDWGGAVACIALIGCLLLDSSSTLGRFIVPVVALTAMLEFATGKLSRMVVSGVKKACSK